MVHVLYGSRGAAIIYLFNLILRVKYKDYCKPALRAGH